MYSKLKEILNQTKKDLDMRKKQNSFESLKKLVGPVKTRSFFNAIINPKFNSIAVIAEIKFASPSSGSLGSHDELLARVKKYKEAGADAISTVTEKHFFHGDPKFVTQIKHETSLPVLQKDFILDKYQIYESAQTGADAILFIARILSRIELVEFVKLAQRLELEPIVEINDENDLKKAVATTTRTIAVNARDLNSFTMDVDRACNLMQKIPNQFIKLGFSGISSKVEIEKYKKAGARGVLIGTSLMKSTKIADFLEGVRI